MKKKLNEYLIDYHEALIESLKNKEHAQAYLQVAIEEFDDDKDVQSFLIALRNVAEAQGGITFLARQTSLNRQNLYRILSVDGNPRLVTLSTILHALGFRLSIQPL